MNFQLFCAISVILLKIASGAEIRCGAKVKKEDLKLINRYAEYVGTEARINEPGNNRYLLIRHYRHKKLKLDILWKEDRDGVVKFLAITKLSKETTASNNPAFSEDLTVDCSEEKIEIRSSSS